MRFMNLSDMIITEVVAFNRINVSKGTIIKRKNRPQWAIAIKTSGKTVYNINGKQYLSDSSHICFLPQGAVYSFECIQPGECLVIEFKCMLETKEIISIETNNINEIIKQFNISEKDSVSKPNGWKLQAFASIYTIISSLINEPKHNSNPYFEMISPAIKYISDNYQMTNITNDFLASLCSVSTVYFRKLFFRCYGISPIAYINNIRIEKAKELLVGDYQSIESISYSVGYSSVYHFSKMFKKKVGVSPSEYAKTEYLKN